MGEVLDMFKQRKAQAAQAVAPTPAAKGPVLLADAKMLGSVGTDGLERLRQMEQQGAAYQVLSALLFYAHQGQDEGQRARRAVLAMQEVINGRPDPVVA